jgi:predicted DsbA family dithiol-disulfide isomerase
MIVLRERRLRPWPHEPGSDATIHACRAVVAAGLRWPDREEALLRALQELSAAGEPLDDSDTLEIAARRAGVPVGELAAYCAEPEVEAALRADMAAARGHTCASLG